MELKPCPFCGSDKIVESCGIDNFLLCENCFAEGPSPEEFGLKTAAGAWNRRVSK